MYIKVKQILSKQSWCTFYLGTLYVDDYFSMYICKWIKMQHTSCKLTYTLLPGIVNQVCVCYTSSILFKISLRFWQQILFLWQKNRIGFFKSSHSAKLYLEVLVKIARLNLKIGSIDSFLYYISFCFFSSSLCPVLLSQKVL